MNVVQYDIGFICVCMDLHTYVHIAVKVCAQHSKYTCTASHYTVLGSRLITIV